MKVYIISDNADNGVIASNVVNKSGNLGIMSELRSGDPKAMLNDLKDNLGAETELALIICVNPKAVAISANKLSGVRAVACKDAEDAEDAINDAKANVILVDSSKVNKNTLSDIIVTWLQVSSGTINEIRASAAKTKAASGGGGSGIMGGIKNAVQRPQQSGKSAPGPDDNLDTGEIIKSVKTKGALKTLKETLGLQD